MQRLGTIVMVGGGYFLCCCVPMLIASDGGDDFEIALSLIIPCLFAWPSIWLVESEDWLVPTYVIGLISYGIASGVIYGSLVNGFDAIVGRTSEQPYRTGEYSRPIPPPADGTTP